MKTMKLRFIDDAVYNGLIVYERGQTYDVPVENGAADRWIKRMKAVQVENVVEQAQPAKNIVAQEPVSEETKKESLPEHSPAEAHVMLSEKSGNSKKKKRF